MNDFDCPPAVDDAPTAGEAGRFLAGLWDRESDRPPHRLPYAAARERIREEFGGRFLRGPAGRERIDADVLEAFRRRAGPQVVYDSRELCWRWGHQEDRPDGEE